MKVETSSKRDTNLTIRNFEYQPEWNHSLGSAGAATTLDLNDDCLLEVFKYLDMPGLCAAADVCSRFGQNAKICFTQSGFQNLDFPYDIYQDKDSQNKLNSVMLRTSRFLSNFGASIFMRYDMCASFSKIVLKMLPMLPMLGTVSEECHYDSMACITNSKNWKRFHSVN